MREPAALQAALALVTRPAQARTASHQPLPSGMTFLLEVAAGENDAASEARRITGRSDKALRRAAGFFIEQCLLSQSDNSYRVLGARAEDPQAALRRHMVLLMKWLHPDTVEQHRSAADVDRSVFASRIAAAWDDLKTGDRRSAYDQRIARRECTGGSGRTAVAVIKLGPTGRATARVKKSRASSMRLTRSTSRPRLRARRYDPLLIRIARLLWRRG